LPNPKLTVPGDDTYIDMGITAENVAKAYGISRADQDAMAYRSHMRAIAAQESGRQAGHIIPLSFDRIVMIDGKPTSVTISLSLDEGPRKDTSLASLARLKPAFLFDGTGTVTAGNSSQVSDGGAVTIIVNRDIANQYGLTPLARLVSFATAGNEPGLMGVAPIWAIPKALQKAGLTIEDLGLLGLNEAFAAQWLAIQRTLNLNPEIINVNGGAIAIGHPLGCTGARDTADTLHEAILREVRYFGVGMCVGGGQGAFAIFENLTI
jgi:acetyl-CoA acyltransferase